VAGAVVGADLGFDIGMAALAWLGIGFLLKAMVEGLGEMTEAVEKGIETAWQARNLSGTAKKEQVDRASRELGKAAGILVRLILQGIVAYLLKKVAVKSTRGAATTVRLIQKEGAAVAADTTIAGLVAKLRASRFGDAFADWIEKNWHDLIRNPRLGGGKGAVQVTAQMIREAMKDAPLRSQQKGGVSLPRVQQFVDRLLGGEQPPPIKVDGNMLVDGNHRYIAARILGEESPIQPWAGGRPTEAIPWNEIPIDPKFW
jgi:hypothetical protein